MNRASTHRIFGSDKIPSPAPVCGNDAPPSVLVVKVGAVSAGLLPGPGLPPPCGPELALLSSHAFTVAVAAASGVCVGLGVSVGPAVGAGSRAVMPKLML